MLNVAPNFSVDRVAVSDTIVSTETNVSDSDILVVMAKKPIKTVTIHARIPDSDVAEIDRAAEEELVSRSNMVARIVREWAKQRQRPPKRRR